MPNRKNQHYVPRYYFRRFSGGDSISLLRIDSGRVIHDAPTRGQCAERYFYHLDVVENYLARLDGQHAGALADIESAAWRGDWGRISPKLLHSLWEVILCQRGRTALEADKELGIPHQLFMPAFRAYLDASCTGIQRERMLEAVDNGQVKIVETRASRVLQSLVTALDMVLLISDLDFRVIRNHTDFPFIFSDAPVVFVNTVMKRVANRGVLGLQSRGLQVFFPLSPSSLLMLFDEATYDVTGNWIIDVVERSDVSQMNALQLHHADRAVYFGHPEATDYVKELWAAHRATLRRSHSEVRTIHGARVDGELLNQPLQMILEPQINLRLDLSFVECDPIHERDFVPGHRDRALVQEHEATRISRRHGEADEPTPSH